MNVAIFSAPPGNLWVDKIAWIAEAVASLGHNVRRFHHFNDLRPADDWADLVLFDQYSAGLPGRNIADAAEDKTSPWVQCWRDLVCCDPSKPVAKQETYFGHGQVMRAMDAVFVKERARIDEYKAAGVNAVYLDCQGCPADMPACQYADEPEFDVLVLGNAERAYASRRADVAALLKAGYRVLWAGLTNTAAPHGVYGHAWVHPTKILPALASRCAVALSVDLRHEPGYTSDRTWLLAGSGIPVIARVPDVDEDMGLSNLAEIAPQAEVASWIYHDVAGLLRCAEQAIGPKPKQYEARRTRGLMGRKRVMFNHTYAHRAAEILRQVESFQAARVA